jgi:predicted O-methyltransferase YrrM
MNLYHVVSVMRHLLTSQSSVGHGVHSPFVYNFLTNVIRPHTTDESTEAAESVRKRMLKDRRVLRVLDRGTGARGRDAYYERRVCDIAAVASLTPHWRTMLSRIVESECRVNPGKGIILELGSSLGISTIALASACHGTDVITVEGCPEISSLAQENFAQHGLSNISMINAEFSIALKLLKEKGTRIRIAFIDGNHSGEALTSYFSSIMEMAGDDITIIADDIHLSKSMYYGWIEVSDDKRIQVSIETQRFGILFKKRSLTPGRFKIRC